MTPQTIPEDEIDLRPYIAALFKHKWLILILAVSFAAVGLIFSLLSTRTYTALSTLLFTRNRATLSIAQDFSNVNEPVDFRSRMEALVDIANSDAMAQRTIQAMGDLLPADLRSTETLSPAVQASSKGDSLIVATTFKDPQVAAAVANMWADELVTTINQAYSGEQPLGDIQEKLVNAQNDYETTQAALEAFIRQNPRPALEAQLKEAQEVLDQAGNDRAIQLTYFYIRKQAMEQLLANAQALKKQVQGGSRSSAGDQGDALAVLWARLNALNMQDRLIQINDQLTPDGKQLLPVTQVTGSVAPLNLQLVVPEGLNDSASNYSADVDDLIKLAGEEKQAADESIRQLTGEILSTQADADNPVMATAARVQELNQQIENARANEDRLTSNRDLAWKAYQALLEKQTEIKNAALSNNQVVITAPAIPPSQPDSRGTLLKTAIAGLVGLFLGAVIAIALELFRRPAA